METCAHTFIYFFFLSLGQSEQTNATRYQQQIVFCCLAQTWAKIRNIETKKLTCFAFDILCICTFARNLLIQIRHRLLNEPDNLCLVYCHTILNTLLTLVKRKHMPKICQPQCIWIVRPWATISSSVIIQFKRERERN